MIGINESIKKMYCYLTWFIFILFSGAMFIMSQQCKWPFWVDVYLLVMFVAMTVGTFNRRVTHNIHSYIFMICAMLNVFVYSYAQMSMENIILIMCGIAVVCSIYRNAKMMLLMFFMNVTILFIHTFVFKSVILATEAEVMQAVINVSVLISSEIAMTFFTEYLNVVERNLKVSLREAKRAEQSKSDFLANMSHEIRTPMNAIVGMCEIILREDISDEVRENCFNIQNSGRSLLAIINDILDFSKIESGKAELILGEFNIGSTINDVINMAVARKGDKNIEIIVRVDPNIPKGLIGDEIRIKQVIINLVTNAIKFTNSGCVVLRLAQDRHDYGINLRVLVRDTGIGISEENIEKLFTSFQQVDTRKNRTVEGTGLGLAISKRLIAKMGGFINLKSVYGEGTQFKFVIPLKVSDNLPFIALKDSERINVAVYIGSGKYHNPRVDNEYVKMINEMVEKFKIGCTIFKDQKSLEEGLVTGKFTYCIITKDEYLKKSAYFKYVADNLGVCVAVVQDRLTAIELPENIKCVYKPLYALSIAALFNNEKILFNAGDINKSSSNFIAPDAKILIVDDNVINLKVASGLMKPYNMKISTAISGYEAIEKVKFDKYDIIFMDHMMPGIDGVETTQIIRNMEGDYYKDVPIIALTANAINGVREMFLENGFSDFVPKPIEISVLNRALKSWLPKEVVISTMDLEEEEPVQKKEIKRESFGEHINSATGLMYAGDSRQIYLDNLSVYMSTGEEYKVSLDKCFSEEDWKQYVIEVHALKSSSLSIGAEVLSELAKSLEFAGKEGNIDLIKAKHRTLIEMYTTVLDEISIYLEENGYGTDEKENELSQTDLKEISIEEAEEYVEKICSACDDFDGDTVVSIIDEIGVYSVNGNPLGQYFAAVKKAAEDFDYDSAAENARKVISEMKEV